MQRTKQHKAPDAILTSDWHLREKTPVCREDDFQKAQWRKVDFVSDLQKKYDCPVIFAGDLFHHWKPSPWLLTKTIEHLPAQFKVIYGNHDLPEHSILLEDKSGVFALKTALALEILPGTHWLGNPKEQISLTIKGRSIIVYHVMTYQGRKPWPGCTDPMSAGLIRKLKANLILTGHNHKPFTETHEGRLLVNPGSLMRQESDQMDFKPRVYLYYADTNTVEPVYLPIEQGVVTRGHIEVKEERDDRINAFISKLETDFEAGLDFKDNLEQFFQTNRVRKIVKELVYKSMES